MTQPLISCCAVLLLLLVLPSSAFLPYQNPPWAPTYSMSRSTLTMVMNFSGFTNAAWTGQFGIVSFDWSNAKAQWVLDDPMTCEEKMLEQAIMTKAANPETRVFVYRNLVKALPWFSSVRKVLVDPSYSGWFLRFSPSAAPYHVPNCSTQNNVTKCSSFYHDQEQTPEVPSPSNPSPDGACHLACHCGSVPCGEYLFDHRNASLRACLLNEYIVSPTSVGSPVIDGLFIDDFWCSDILNGSGACTDPVQGPTEINKHNQQDMGLTDADVLNITTAWLDNMREARETILRAGGFTWSLMPGQANANAMPDIIEPNNCASSVRHACTPTMNGRNRNDQAPILHGLTNLPNNTRQQVAAFLLMRGKFAYIGWGQWGMVWPYSVPLPDEIWGEGADYGEPIDATCVESSPGLFTRQYTRANITLDCNTWKADITKAKIV